MQTLLRILIIVTGVALLGCSRVQTGPLTMQVPPNWKAERQHPGRLDFYSLTAGSPGFGLLMFSRWPPQSSPEEIPDLVRKRADGFLERGKGGQVNVVSDSYTVESFGGEGCKGNYAVFQTGTNGNAVAAMFMIRAFQQKL